MAKIELNNMEFYAFHGCMDFEREKGNRFFVDLCVEGKFAKAIESDVLEDTLDYSLLYNAVDQEMKQTCNLLEHLAGNIIKSVRTQFPFLEHIRVRVSKMNPPIPGSIIGSSAVELTEKDINY